jgi:hypothetical protein
MSTADSEKRGRLALIAGLLLLLCYVVVASLMATGPFEFAYVPNNLHDAMFSAMRGFTFEQLYKHCARLALLFPALGLLTFGLYRKLESARAPSPTLLKKMALWTSVISVLYTAFLMLGILRGTPIVDDELAYRLQAALMLEGKLGLESLAPMHLEPMLIQTKLGITGKYLFGEPLAQLPGVLVGIPALAHLLFNALSLLMLYRAVKLMVDESVAAWSVILLALSPMLMFTAATAQSQATALFAVLAMGLGYAYVCTDKPWRGVIIAAMGLGFGATVRVQSLFPVGAVFGIALAVVLIRRRRILPGVLFLAIVGGWLAAIAAYNQALTGDPLKLPWFLSTRAENYGFTAIVDGHDYIHSPWRALQNLLVVLVRFNGWWLGWPASLALIWFWNRMGRPRSRLALLWVGAGLAVILFEAGYYSTGVSDTGPIYHFELLIPATLLGAHAIVKGLERFPRLIVTALALHFFVGSAMFIYEETGRINRLALGIDKDARKVIAHVKRPAVIYYELFCGERIHLGWLLSGFPRRYWLDSDEVMTLPLPKPAQLDKYLAAYKDRHCYYYRRNPRRLVSELWDCRRAQRLMRHRRRRGRCVIVRSTARRLGYAK